MSNRRKSRRERDARRATSAVYFDPASDEREFVGPYEIIKVDADSDFGFDCPQCGSEYSKPFAGLRAPTKTGPPDALTIGCQDCSFQTELTLTPEHHNDGTSTYWFDACALHSGAGETEHMYMELELEDGRRVIHMVGQRKHGTLATCEDCGLPWTTTGEMSVTSLSDAPVSLDLVVAPCPHCGGTGRATQSRSEHGGLVTFATSQHYADSALRHLLEGMESGEINRLEAAAILRARGDRRSLRVAEWLEAHSVPINTACAVVSALASVGALAVALDQGDEPARTGYTEEEVVEIIDTVLDHYDQVQREQTPTPARPKHGERPAKGRVTD